MDLAPVSFTMARSRSGFSSMGQGRSILPSKGWLSWYAMRGTSASPAGGSPGCSRVHVGVVDKHAGLHIALGVDVEIPPAAGDAAAHVLRVILEVHGEDGLRAAEGPDVLIHLRALLRRPALASSKLSREIARTKFFTRSISRQKSSSIRVPLVAVWLCTVFQAWTGARRIVRERCGCCGSGIGCNCFTAAAPRPVMWRRLSPNGGFLRFCLLSGLPPC